MAPNYDKIKLNNGLSIPLVGLGTFRTANDPEKLKSAIKYAIHYGYRHLDCAWLYGNEDVIGQAIKEALVELNGAVKREDLFITSKIWNTHHSKDLVRQGFEETIKNLDVGYLDLFLVHWPMGFAENKGMGPFPKDEQGNMIFSDVHYLETYHALEELVAEGKVKSIGVSNFNISQLEDVLKNCKIKPAVNQVELHPYLQNDELVEFCQKNDIVVTAYAPLGAADRSVLKPEDQFLLENDVIVKLADKYKKTPAQICLKWAIQKNIVVVPKSVTPSRLSENIEKMDFDFTPEEMAEIKSINKNLRIYAIRHLNRHPFYPFNGDIVK